MKVIFHNFQSTCQGFLFKVPALLFCLWTGNGSYAQISYPIKVTTSSNAPVIPNISQYLSSNRVTSSFMYTPSGEVFGPITAYIYGKIERLSPSTIVIAPNSGFQSKLTASIPQNGTVTLNNQLGGAFDNFNKATTSITGVDPASIRDLNDNIILPDGVYRICFTAKNGNNGAISDPTAGCSMMFTVSCQRENAMVINTIVKPLVNPVIAQTVASNGVVSTMQFNNTPGCNVQVRLYGTIERISPTRFTITTSSKNTLNQPFTPGASTQITPAMQAQAFGNFIDKNLTANGVDLATITDANNNIRLPDGNYRICYYARYSSNLGLGGFASNQNLGCGNFTICNNGGVAPQFTQPVNSLSATTSQLALVKPASPVIFTWTPPQSTCGITAGAITYDFEIREIFPNQTITDALNNPYVFRKTGLPSTTFLLDTNINRNVLQIGKQYATRVRAVSTNLSQPITIDNNGYSRVEGFQYGNNARPKAPDFNVYYIPFIERRSDFWDNMMTDYENHKRGDTAVPLNQYIPLVLAKNNFVYSLDAIELFLVLNPELTEMDRVKLSYSPKLPQVATVPISNANNFRTEHAMNLKPDIVEENRFKKYLDSLNVYVRTQKTNVQGGELVELVKHLNIFSRQVRITDRVTMNLVNTLLSELLFELKVNPAQLNKRDFNQLKAVIANVEELLTATSEATSFLNKYEDQILSYNKIKNPAGYGNVEPEESEYLPALMDPLLPFDVMLCRYTKEPPITPITTTPDLMGTYKVYYVLSSLYNHRNPEINAKSTNTPASIALVSLPRTTFRLWTENILNRTKTREQDIDFMDAFLHSKKRWPYSKHYTIIIKAD